MKKAKKNFAQKAYGSTHINSGTSQQKIIEMLEKLGITEVQITKMGSDYSVQFIVKLRHDESPRKVRINVPIDVNIDEKMDEERRTDIVFRVLYWHLKNRFVTIQNGLQEFDSEFLGDIVIVHEGKEMRVADILVPRIREQLKSSSIVTLKIEKPHA